MGEYEQKGVVEGLVCVLRRITRVVQLLPFAYLLGYVLVLVLYNIHLPDMVLSYLDAFFYVSPMVVVSHIIYSSVLRLCRWHRIACVAPLVSPALLLLDGIFDFGVGTAMLLNASITIMICLFIVSAYKVFVTP